VRGASRLAPVAKQSTVAIPTDRQRSLMSSSISLGYRW
jgi:hypothetical protein